MAELTVDGILRDQHDAIVVAVQARLCGDESMLRIAAQRELSESDLSRQVLGFWLKALGNDLTLGSTVTTRQNLHWMASFRVGHELVFDDVLVRRMFDDISAEIEARLETEALRAEYADYKAKVAALIDEVFPG